MSRGILISPYSAESENMAWALVRSIRRYNTDLPVLVLEQDYVGRKSWRDLAKRRTIRAAEPHRSPRQWYNKLAVLARMPFEETLFLDCDMLAFSDPEEWFGLLGTDDFTFFPAWQNPDLIPDSTQLNLVNPHRMREHFGTEKTAVISGGGHFFIRRTDRARSLLDRVVDIMEEASDRGTGSLYHRMAGPGNIPASDELAASIMMAEQQVALPPEDVSETPPLHIFLPPAQRDAEFDFAGGKAEYFCEWKGRRVRPGAVHFCAHGKLNPIYRAWVEEEATKPAFP